jgi:molecular chaperone DnaK (HSP70)
MNPINTVFDAKRLIGRKFSDAPVQSDIKLWPFKVKSGPAEKPMIVVEFKGESKEFAAEEISSMVLIKMCVRRQSCCRARVTPQRSRGARADARFPLAGRRLPRLSWARW